ncbi:hypothetical protein C1922_07090 [Stenotrophomonas sp. ZAC14D2_NAIMI4_7]|nr:hypothetical protein C1922_07090 [Stenotrophomonas sp. ZAC14D2_NAIMI4_7]
MRLTPPQPDPPRLRQFPAICRNGTGSDPVAQQRALTPAVVDGDGILRDGGHTPYAPAPCGPGWPTGGSMQRMLVLLPLLLAAGEACAQRVYKCNDGGRTIYQSTPCPAGQDTGVTRPIVRDPKLSWQEAERVDRELRVARRELQANAGRGAAPVTGTVIEAASNAEACDKARTRRELAEWFGSRTPARQLNDDVTRSCASR